MGVEWKREERSWEADNATRDCSPEESGDNTLHRYLIFTAGGSTEGLYREYFDKYLL